MVVVELMEYVFYNLLIKIFFCVKYGSFLSSCYMGWSGRGVLYDNLKMIMMMVV